MNRIQTERLSGGTYTYLGYRTVRLADRDGLYISGASGDRHLIKDRLKLIDVSRDFWRNNPIYKGMIDRAVAYIVGRGFGLQMRTQDEDINNLVENRLWRAFWERPEIRNLQSGVMTEKMVIREAMLAGDVGVIKTSKGVLQIIEAEQIAGPTEYPDGIVKDLYGTPQMFFVSRYNEYGKVDRTSARKYRAKDFLFVANLDRPSSSRGVPAAQAAFPMLHRINDVCDSEAVAWQMLSKLAVAVIREEGPEQAYAESTGLSGPSSSSAAGQSEMATRMTELDYALFFHGNPGESIQGIDRNIPGRNFTESIRMFLRLLGLPLGLPLEIVLLDWTQSNYSQSRAVLEQAYQTFQDWQDLLEYFFLDEVLSWKIKQWIDDGVLPARDDYDWEWIRPTFPWIDQLKEAEAKGGMVDRGFMTHSQVCKALGTDRETIMKMRQREVIEAINLAKAVEAQTGQPVPWRIFAGMKGEEVMPNMQEQESND
ncbi:MAG TPA: phage portal protein [Anaerohalosphaeraceae bacterium]|nr:phage portal protein [Anaerohalosphaeraceae bacterium]